jgi:iron(III) transport system substrate-binding protein
MRQIRGDESTLTWLKSLAANDPQKFEKNSQIVEALDSKLISLGLVNHYYIYEVADSLAREINVKNGYFAPGDVGNLLNVSAFGILKTSKNIESANKLLEYLLSESAQQKFVTDSFEFSLIPSINPPKGMPKLEELQIPNVSLGQLSDVGRTQELLLEAGLL